MQNDILIRPIHPGDAGSVSELVTQLGYARTSEDVEAWILTPKDGSQVAFVAVLHGAVAGWIEASIERRIQSAPFALIGGLVVRDGVRGQRIGQRLCEAVEQWARERGLQSVRVTSRSTRPDAHRFYLRDGYHEVKTSLVFEKRL